MRNTHCRKLSRRPAFPAVRTAGLLGALSASSILVPTLVSAVSAAPEVTLMEAAPTVGGGATYNLHMGKVLRIPVDSRATVKYVSGGDLVRPAMGNDVLTLTPLRPGRVVLQTSAPGQETETYIVRVVAAGTPVPPAAAPPSLPISMAASQVLPSPTPEGAGDAGTVSATSSTTTTTVTTTTTAPVTTTVPAGMAVPETPVVNNGTSISAPVLPPPINMPSRVPRVASPPSNSARPSAQSIPIKTGMARLLTTNSNILAVFFSDENVMDARAINARTLAVTGKNPGRATLAIFTARYPDDVVGQARVYTVEIQPQVQEIIPVPVPTITDPGIAESAIRAALDDRRISVSVIRTPAGGLVAVLTGTVRASEEVEAAKRITAFFVPEVVSSLVVDPKAPELGTVALSTEETLQSKLRLLTGNESIQIVPFPNSLVVKAEVDSPARAEELMRLLPSLNQKVTPLIVIRGGANAATVEPTLYTPERPVLNEEDERNTQNLQGVTGLRSIYVVRTAKNGLAVYGTVRDRAEYERLRRYARILPQVSDASSDGKDVIPSNAPYGGNQYPVGVQLFVRILDPEAAYARQVNVETNVVEISRTGLRNLGVEFGSVALLSQTVGAPVTTVIPGVPGVPGENGNPGTPPIPGTSITVPGIVSRTIDPTFRPGVAVGGNGLIGEGGFNFFDPFRARLNALYQNGTARILSQPNLSVLEGVDAQIVIGGERPIPVTTASGGGSGTVQESIEFRRFGIILTMRPTVADDNTIFLQIRGSVTEIDFTTAIIRNNAQIPGERVRSVDTMLTVREGDTIVMGGLMTNERRQATTKVPILSQIPILGKLFQSKRFENNESELAIFMTPRIRRMAVSPEGGEWVKWAPGMPPLPDNQGATEAFAISGTPRTSN